MTGLIKCDTCGNSVDEDEIGCWENQQCNTCFDAWLAKEIAYWKPRYEAEKAAGLLKGNADLAAELRDAGRGHLVPLSWPDILDAYERETDNLGDF